MFVHVDRNTLVHADAISRIDISRIEDLIVRVHVLEPQAEWLTVTGPHAITLLMQLRPSALENRRLRWAKDVWALHNLIGHPLMQLLAFARCYRAALWVHDHTVPWPRA